MPKLTPEDFWDSRKDAVQNNIRRSATTGPCYNGKNPKPTIWYDQQFGYNLIPSGTVTCPFPLRVGFTQQSLEVVVMANMYNRDQLFAAPASTITMILSEGDSDSGAFAPVGPTYCVTAPATGIIAEPDEVFVRFPLGNMAKPWAMVELTFAGSFTGGNIDVVLSYVAR